MSSDATLSGRACTAALVAMALSACAAGPQAPRTEPALQSALALEELSPRDLPDGRCTLILYSRDPSPRRILVAFDSPAEAVIQTGGQELRLQRQAVSGDVQYGHAQRAEYASPAGPSISVTLTFEATPARDGAPVKDATVALSRPTGESIVVPAVGVAACTPSKSR